MNEGRRRLVVMFFLFIFVVFGGMLAYLTLFNTGLEIDERFNPETGEKIVLFKNNSSRIINNVVISYIHPVEGKKALDDFPAVKPQQEVPLDFNSIRNLGQITIVAEAPFHQAVEKLVVLKAGETGLVYNLNFPSKIFKGSTFNFEFELCNEQAGKKTTLITEVHNETFFAEGGTEKEIEIDSMDCTQVTYFLTPTQTGETTIFFNVKIANNTEKLEKRVVITE